MGGEFAVDVWGVVWGIVWGVDEVVVEVVVASVGVADRGGTLLWFSFSFYSMACVLRGGFIGCVQDGYKYVQAMLSVLKNVTKDETVQYVLAMLDEILVSSLVMTGPSARPLSAAASVSATSPVSAAASPGGGLEEQGGGRRVDRVGILQGLFFPGVEGCTSPYGVLTKLLSREDWFTREKAARVLSVVLVCGAEMGGPRGGVVGGEGLLAGFSDLSLEEGTSTTQVLIDWCVHELKKPSHPQFAVPTALHCLSLVLKESETRRTVYASGGVQAIVGVLTREGGQHRGMDRGANTVSVQAQYELALCVWLLSLFPPAAEVLATPGVMKALVDYVRLAHKEKVIRVSLLALKSLLANDTARHSTAISLELSAVRCCDILGGGCFCGTRLHIASVGLVSCVF